MTRKTKVKASVPVKAKNKVAKEVKKVNNPVWSVRLIQIMQVVHGDNGGRLSFSYGTNDGSTEIMPIKEQISMLNQAINDLKKRL